MKTRNALLLVLMMICFSGIVVPSPPFTDVGGLPQNIYDTLKPVDVRVMLRGYCYATSQIVDEDAYGGFGGSSNKAQSIPTDFSVAQDILALVAQPDWRVNFAKGYQGMRLLLVNTTKRNIPFLAQDSRLYIVQEARDSSGQWRFIEYLPSSWCGNSYHNVSLPANSYWSFAAPRYKGTFATTLRFKLFQNKYGFKTWLTSNEFAGSVNPEQFTDLAPYMTRNIMSPYNNVASSGICGLIDVDGALALDTVYEDIEPFAQGFARIRHNGKYGYINGALREAIPPHYDIAEDFVNGVAMVNIGARMDVSGKISGGKWGLIDTNGAYIFLPEFDRIHLMRDSVSYVIGNDDKYGLAFANGVVAAAPQYDYIQLHGGSLYYVTRDSLCGFINRSGATVIDPMPLKREHYSNGFTAIETDQGWGFIDSLGIGICPPHFSNAGYFTEGLAPVAVNDAKNGTLWGYIDASGSIAITPQFDDAEQFSNGRARIERDALYGFINTSGAIVIEPRFSEAEEFRYGSAIVANWDGEFLIDTGGARISAVYDAIYYNTDTLLQVTLGGKKGFISSSGYVVHEPAFDQTFSFHGEFALVSDILLGNGLLNRAGELVLPLEFDDIELKLISEGLIPASKDEKWGFYDFTGALRIPHQYDRVSSFSGGRAKAWRDERLVIIDRTGRAVPTPPNAYIEDFRDGFAVIRFPHTYK